MRNLRQPFVFALTMAMTALPHIAAAQALEVAPVTVDLPAGRATTIIRITNRGDQATAIQVRPFAWTQDGGEDRLTATSDLMVSPPFSTLAPGDTQTIRIVLRKPAEMRESAYRMLIDQLPSVTDPGSIQLALRISLPVFAAPAVPVRTALSWQLAGDDPVKRTLIVRNTGTRRAKITALKVGETATLPGFTFRYVLPGSQASIPVEAGAGGWASRQGHVHVSGTTDQGKVEADAPLVPAA